MNKSIYTLLLATALIAGCKKDPDMVGPSDQVSTNSYPKTIADLNTILNPAYGNLKSTGLYGFELMPKALENSVHAGDANYNGDGAWNEMTANNLSPNNGKSTNAWVALYAGAGACNTALEAADFFEKTYANGSQKAEIDAVRGQAKFMRAFYYFQLEALFGEAYIKTGGINENKMGVPIYMAVPKSVTETQQPRATTKEVWDFIKSDLKDAVALLDNKVWPSSEIGRANKWSAKALLGKVYVFTEDWANAKTTLLDVINNSGKTLMPFAKYKDAFNGNTANEFNEESLFEMNVDADNKGNYGPWGNIPNASTLNGVIWSPYILSLTGTETGSRPLGYGGNLGVHDKNVTRFGYPLGYYTLVNNPNFDNSKPASFSNPAKIMDPVYRAKAEAVRTNKTADPRLYVNLVQPWLDVLNIDWEGGPRQNVPVSKPDYLASEPNTYGWGFRKYAAIDYHLNIVNYDKWNWYFLRMADVYLLYAEASIGSGDVATGLEYINKVKRRAYDLPINSASPRDYTSLSAATPAINDPVLGTNPLRYERWAELFHEGQWWFDVCRWRLGPQEAAFYGRARNLSTPLTFNEAKSYSWPIPLSEFNSNSKITGQQNPNY
ncbi:RagB/SusD family nutrient uptake outer membrane protein [Pedobacter panaciterrae]|uniref:RagB/SusD family nutrient uptake outer membrane protein n=1 Tax=Pedobacter panaciterrae TaxID=363849 RepID=UPI00155DCEC1|nr:RagB/SusD family nutrient uptake outer membrane protein [Pedobacter panaciterrae]NQX56366.1 RagB/SusD family nutrient uptake outer membrane protein [Pedobacter panaciterrae]